MNDERKMNYEQVKALVHGAVAIGYKIYGDSFIGYRAFNDDGIEFDFSIALEYSDGECCDSNIDEFRINCEKLVVASHNDCEFWD